MERARVRVSLDSVEVADGLGRLGLDRGEPVEVLVEVDTGHHRLGRPPGGPTAELATGIDRVAGIEVLGLLSHAGHAYRASSPGELKRIVEREGADLGETAERCRAAGVEIREISVGTTPTARIEAGIGGITELRPGTYVFNDAQQMRLGTATEATSAARVLTTVVARPWEDRFVIDAGSKSLSSDGFDGDETPFPGRGVIAGRPDLRLDFLTEEHGVGTQRRTEAAGAPLAIGDRLEVIPLHVCSCVNMFDVAFGIRNGSVVEEFAIAGRGRVS
jgi:D-serine deaminase-like pyridoxal phosphate-dependent protein